MKNRLQGQAYAFFDCDASKEIIESKMPILRRESQTPSDLEPKRESNSVRFRAFFNR